MKWASLVAQLVKNQLAMWETWVQSMLGRSPGEGKGYLPTPGFWPGEFDGLYSPWGHKEMKHQIIPDAIPAQVIVGSLRIDPKSTASHITECFLHCIRVATH